MESKKGSCGTSCTCLVSTHSESFTIRIYRQIRFTLACAMNTLIRTKGYILDTSIIEPITEKLTGNKIYRLSLMPESPSVFDEINERAREAKELHLRHFNPNPDFDFETRSKGFKDRITKDDCLLFESLFRPKLEGFLGNLERDELLIPEFVQVVGHIQVQEYGNCFLSFHIVEPAFQEGTELEL